MEMDMQGAKKNFRIEQISKKLGLKKSTLRDWEEQFNLGTNRQKGSNRHYTSDDFAVFSTIKDLSAQKVTKEEIAEKVSLLVKAQPRPTVANTQQKTAPTTTPHTKTPTTATAVNAPPTITPPQKLLTTSDTPTPKACNHKNVVLTIKAELQALHTKLSKPYQTTKE